MTALPVARSSPRRNFLMFSLKSVKILEKIENFKASFLLIRFLNFLKVLLKGTSLTCSQLKVRSWFNRRSFSVRTSRLESPDWRSKKLGGKLKFTAPSSIVQTLCSPLALLWRFISCDSQLVSGFSYIRMIYEIHFMGTHLDDALDG